MAKKLEKAQVGKIVKAAAKRAITASEVSIPRSVGSYGNGKIGNIATRKVADKKLLRGIAATTVGVPIAAGAGMVALKKSSNKSASDTTATKKKMGGAFDNYKSKKKK